MEQFEQGAQEVLVVPFPVFEMPAHQFGQVVGVVRMLIIQEAEKKVTKGKG